ncbi:MAG: hypothetical protein JWP80_3809, partial [Pseudomonas sp.]|nr:hypothetical protein [Pseudomonas sp.]
AYGASGSYPQHADRPERDNTLLEP